MNEERTAIDNLLGCFLLNRGITHTTTGHVVRPLEFYAMRLDPSDMKWASLTPEEAAAWDEQNAPATAPN